MAEDWLDKFLKEKQTSEKLQEDADEKELRDAAKLQALLPEFWQAIVKTLQSDLERYNQMVYYTEKLYYKPLGRYQFLIEKQSHPSARLTLSMDASSERLKAHYEHVPLPDRSLQIRLREDNLYLESAPGTSVPDREISREVLEDFLRKVQGG